MLLNNTADCANSSEKYNLNNNQGPSLYFGYQHMHWSLTEVSAWNTCLLCNLNPPAKIWISFCECQFLLLLSNVTVTHLLCFIMFQLIHFLACLKFFSMSCISKTRWMNSATIDGSLLSVWSRNQLVCIDAWLSGQHMNI